MALLIAAVIFGGAQGAIAQPPGVAAASADESPGLDIVAERYDIGGRQLFLACVGGASGARPAVIAEAGLGGDSSAFGALVPLLAGAPFRACAYDRAGQGNSDPPPDGAGGAPAAVTTEDAAGDLHALLAAAGVEPPYILVAHSIGGWFARVFTARYPEEVVGLVFVDSSHPDQAERLRAILPPARDDEDGAVTRTRDASDSLSAAPIADTGWLDLVKSAAQVRASGDLGDRPVVVLTHEGFMSDLPSPYQEREAAAWLAMQDELASLSTRGVQRIVAGAGHAIQEDAPGAVVDAILEVQAAVADTP